MTDVREVKEWCIMMMMMTYKSEGDGIGDLSVEKEVGPVGHYRLLRVAVT